MRVLVTRPEPGASRTAAQLKSRGHEAVVAPLMVVRASGEDMPGGRFDALVLTSANALAARAHLDQTLPVLAVGERTAAGAREAGFSQVLVAAGDRQALAALAHDALAPGRRLLVAVGRDRKPDIARLLEEAGHEPVVWTAYLAEAVRTLPDLAREALRHRRLDAVLHFSRRSAVIALTLARQAALEAPFLALRHVCLSADVGAPLGAAGVGRLVAAKFPDEPNLMAALESVAGSA